MITITIITKTVITRNEVINKVLYSQAHLLIEPRQTDRLLIGLQQRDRPVLTEEKWPMLSSELQLPSAALSYG